MVNSDIHILSLETSQNSSGSVAALVGLNLMESVTLPIEERSAVALAPAVDSLLKRRNWNRTENQASDVQLIGVVRGPGSFTGLRIGITTAKMLSFAWKIPVVGVLGTDCIALQVAKELGADFGKISLCLNEVDPPIIVEDGTDQSWSNSMVHKISIAIDAHRQQVFTADYFYEPSSMSLQLCKPTQLVDIDQWIASLTAMTHVAGPVLEKLQSRIASNPHNITVAPQSTWIPQASTAGVLAWHQHQTGMVDDPFQLEPLYLRPSYAEEKRSS
jgi:tRNA threonylcarbamoyladenosine biosynthesis protein TsaB